MDILYVIGNGSKWNNNELRYSLRSIDKFGHNVDRVFICGIKPDFVNDSVRFRAGVDNFGRKHKNIYGKIRSTICDTDISDHFLISSDDHFFIKDIDFNTLPIYIKKPEIQKRLSLGQRGEYFRSLVQTRELLLRHHLPIFQTNPHCNTHFDVKTWRENQSLFDEGLTLPDGAETNCLMGNLLIAKGWHAEQMKDCKLKYFRSMDELKEKLRDRSWFSIHDEAIHLGIGQYLEELFPYKSRWER